MQYDHVLGVVSLKFDNKEIKDLIDFKTLKFF